MNEPKISVIIPVYKVEPYLRKCLDSVVGQTYQNLEIIVVDDGSPDNSGAVCDEYAERDDRIRVIHKENGGVSSARNTGLETASGEWIGWVDSDDWIEPDMYAYLLENALKYHADVAICGHVERHKAHGVPKACADLKVLNTEEALELLLRDNEVKSYLWDKLWRHDLFEGIRFPEGRAYEDVAATCKLFMKASCVVCLPEVKYNYLQRQGSILGDTSLRNRINRYWAAKGRYDDMYADWPQLRNFLTAQRAAAAVGVWCGYTSNPQAERKKYAAEIQEIADFAGKNCKQARAYQNLGVTGRVVLHLTPYAKWWAFALAGWISRIYKLKHGRRL